MQKTVEKIVDEAAKEFNLPKEVILAIFESPYKCARQKISEAKEEGSFVNVRFKKLGLLYADKFKIKAIENARRNRSNKNN